MYRVRRRRALPVAALGLALAYTALVEAGHPLGGKAHALNDGATVPMEGHRAGGSTVRWPVQGQAALLLGTGRPAASPHQQPAAIASLAKVMTAYLTLKRYPLTGAQAGFTVTITAADAQAEADDVSEGQSGVDVRMGERLTERQLLEALLIPSGNNIAEILGDEVAGSQTGFVAEMNAEARALGMNHTLYTDPSGFDPNTVSTAADQLRIFRQAIRSSGVSSDHLDGKRDATGRREPYEFQPADRGWICRQDRFGLRCWRVPGVLHPRHGPRPPTDRCRRGDGAGGGRQHLADSHRRRRGGRAARRLRHPPPDNEPQEKHE